MEYSDDVSFRSACSNHHALHLIEAHLVAPERGAIDIGQDIDIEARERRPARWRDIWSAGHSVSGVGAVLPVADLVARTKAEYDAASRR